MSKILSLVPKWFYDRPLVFLCNLIFGLTKNIRFVFDEKKSMCSKNPQILKSFKTIYALEDVSALNTLFRCVSAWAVFWTCGWAPGRRWAWRNCVGPTGPNTARTSCVCTRESTCTCWSTRTWCWRRARFLRETFWRPFRARPRATPWTSRWCNSWSATGTCASGCGMRRQWDSWPARREDSIWRAQWKSCTWPRWLSRFFYSRNRGWKWF